jgi:hypothetical protein
MPDGNSLPSLVWGSHGLEVRSYRACAAKSCTSIGWIRRLSRSSRLGKSQTPNPLVAQSLAICIVVRAPQPHTNTMR